MLYRLVLAAAGFGVSGAVADCGGANAQGMVDAEANIREKIGNKSPDSGQPGNSAGADYYSG